MRRLLLIGLLATSQALPASAVWMVASPEKCGATTALRVEVSGFEFDPRSDGGFIPRVREGHHALTPDQPDLPFMVQLIPVPRNCEARIELVDLASIETNVPPVLPVGRQEAREVDDGRRVVERVPGERGAIYARDTFWPDDILTISYANQGTQRWARIVFHPLQYNPVRGILRWNKSINARLHWQATPVSE